MSKYHTLYPSLTKVDPLRMTLDEIHIEDIAHHLARCPRFGCGMAGFISTGGHSLDVLYAAKNEYPNASAEFYLTFLMHDGEEYVFGDIQRDLKKTKTYDGPRKAAEKLSKLIAKKYGLIYPYPKQLKRIDRIIGDRENEIDRYDSTRLDSYELTKARFLKEFYALTEGKA